MTVEMQVLITIINMISLSCSKAVKEKTRA
jgi:hypothetical protein